jgi:hypothetical protein
VPSTLGIVAAGEDVLNDAVFWVDAARSSVVSGALSNLGTGGSALNAQFGNTTGVDTFDPALLTHTGTNYLWLPGSSVNYADTPSTSALNITGDIELEVVFHTAPDWTSLPSTNGALLGKETASNRSYVLRRTLGALTVSFVWSVDGSTVTSVQSTSNVPAGSNAIKVQHDVDNGSSQNTVTFYTSSNYGVSYSQLGNVVTTSGVTSHYVGTAAVTVGTSLSGNLDAAGYRRAIVRNGIGGTTVFDADFTTGITSGAQTTFTESSANAATVTINRSTSGRKAVAVVRPTLLFGTDDYLEVADNALLNFGASDSFTVVAVVRQWATPTSFGRTIQKAPVTGAGWQMLNNSTLNLRYFAMTDGTTNVNAGTGNPYTAGSMAVTTAVRNTVADTITLYNGTTAQAATNDSTTSSLSNSNVMRIGTASTGGAAADFELLAAAVWRRALNANEIATIVARYT